LEIINTPRMPRPPIIPDPAGHPRIAAFTLTEVLVVLAVIAVLAALLIPAATGVQENARNAKNLARMKTVATALLTGAGENRGFLPSSPSTRGRWPTAAHQYFGIRTDLDASKWGDAGLINPIAYTAEVMRPVQLDHMRKAMLAGSATVGPVGIWLVSNRLIWRGTTVSSNGMPMPLHSVVAPSKTPLVSMPSEDNGLGTWGKAVHPSAREQGFTGQTDSIGPAPAGNGKMFYVMCDGSAQTLPDFWPFQDSEWPEPWKAFHPLGKNAPASDAP
jgi:prepilin-type N-terminal cleavage/methylation domain-containing protein